MICEKKKTPAKLSQKKQKGYTTKEKKEISCKLLKKLTRGFLTEKKSILTQKNFPIHPLLPPLKTFYGPFLNGELSLYVAKYI